MTYPTLERYQEVLQFPNTAFRGDAELAHGAVAKDGFGLPLVMCGGFALTYTFTLAQKRKVALRCFHKESRDLEYRYTAVSSHLEALKSPYFVRFSFVKSGIWVDGAAYPIVKMEWASGVTLGEFVEQYYDDPARLGRLIDALRRLALYLESQGVAHGDIQPGNLMVSSDGASVKLIDYDGMFVPALAGMHSAELGHRNFQHPGRDHTLFNAKLDRFAFISLDIALRAVRATASLWVHTHSDADSFVFRANDFVSPQTSPVFASLSRIGEVALDIASFATICLADAHRVPSLADFVLGQGIPAGPRYFAPELGARFARGRYLPSHPVVDASNFAAALEELDEVVELVGMVVDVANRKTKDGNNRPYVFINFGEWRPGNSVRLTIWDDVLRKMKTKPQSSWKGRWLSVKGQIRRRKERDGRVYVQLVVSAPGQIHTIDEHEARYRLDSERPDAMSDSPSPRVSANDNVKLLAGMGAKRPATSAPQIRQPLTTQTNVSTTATGGNSQLLAKMRVQQQSPTIEIGGRGRGQRPLPPTQTTPNPSPLKPAPPPPPQAVERQHRQAPSAPPPTLSPTSAYEQAPFKPKTRGQGLPGWVYVMGGLCLLIFVMLILH
jgi:hypothetical protein